MAPWLLHNVKYVVGEWMCSYHCICFAIICLKLGRRGFERLTDSHVGIKWIYWNLAFGCQIAQCCLRMLFMSATASINYMRHMGTDEGLVLDDLDERMDGWIVPLTLLFQIPHLTNVVGIYTNENRYCWHSSRELFWNLGHHLLFATKANIQTPKPDTWAVCQKGFILKYENPN